MAAAHFPPPSPLLLLLLLLIVPRTDAFDAARCSKFAAEGLCSKAHTAKYMTTHCAEYCVVEELGTPEAEEEDPSCARWKEAGYCEHEQYAEYMARSCSRACGVASSAAQQGDLFEGVQMLQEEADEEGVAPASGAAGYTTEFDETGTEIIEDVPPSQPAPESEDGTDHENCAAWAKQGLCSNEQYAEYMQQNCKRTCAGDTTAAAATSSSDDPATEPTPENCLSWARRGMCAPESQYQLYMDLNCAETCANIDEILARELPPSSIVPLILTVGFFALLIWAAREALNRDANRSFQVGKSWQKVGADIGEEPTIGPGKPNKFRSAKRKTPASLKKVQ